MIIILKLKMAEFPIQFLVRLHFFRLLSKIDTDAILYKVKGINKLSRLVVNCQYKNRDREPVLVNSLHVNGHIS